MNLALLLLFVSLAFPVAQVPADASSAQSPEVEAAPVSRSVAIGGSVTIANRTGEFVVLNPTLGGEALPRVILAPGQTRTFDIPNDPSLVGLTLTIEFEALFMAGRDVLFTETYDITAGN